MKLNEINRDDFRRNFENDFPGFLLRIRDINDRDETKKNKPSITKDLAYYDGIKVFEVGVSTKDKNGITIDFPTNTYKCNTTSVMKIENMTSEAEEDEMFNSTNKEDYINGRVLICKAMKDWFSFTMDKINISNVTNSNPSKIEEGLIDFQRKAKDIISDEILSTDEINKAKTRFEEWQKNNIGKKSSNKTDTSCTLHLLNSLSSDDAEDNIKKILELQYQFIKSMKCNGNYSETISGPSFSGYKAVSKFGAEFDELLFRKAVEKAVYEYEGKGELEKQYQHIFMLHGNKDTGMFEKNNENCEIYPFEQEYAIINWNKPKNESEDNKSASNYKRGRIDCIFYQYDKKENKLTDIYLIEIKVNEKVALGSNGVLTHLEDIASLFIDKDGHIDETRTTNYFDQLVKRIQYRYNVLNNTDITFNNKWDGTKYNFNIHFYTLFSYTDSEEVVNATGYFKYGENENRDKVKVSADIHRSNVNNILKDLCTEGGVKNLIKSAKFEFVDEIDKSVKYYSIDKLNSEYFDNGIEKNIIHFVSMLNDMCDIKFFEDTNIWNSSKDERQNHQPKSQLIELPIIKNNNE